MHIEYGVFPEHLIRARSPNQTDVEFEYVRANFKQVTLPNGEPGLPRPWDTAATSLQLALARGHKWLAMLESGEVSTLTEIAKKEGIDNSYVSRMVNLTTLAPDIIDAILLNELPDHLTLFDLAVDPPALWDEQRARLEDV